MKPRILVKGKFRFQDIRIVSDIGAPFPIDPDIGKQITNAWEGKVAEYALRGVKIWDGIVYRANGISYKENGGAITDVELKLGLVNFRYILAYNDYQQYFDAHPAQSPNHVTVGTLLQTADGFRVFGVRSKDNIHQSNIDIIGGYLAHNEMAVHSGQDIYANLLKELHEETGITEDMIEQYTGIGMVVAENSNLILMADTKLKLTREEILKVFEKRLEGEMQDLDFLREEQMAVYLKNSYGYREILPDLIDGLC